MTINIKDITKINVKPGDFLYIQLPDYTSSSQLPAIFKQLKEAFEDQQVKILVGTTELKFSATTFEKSTEEGPLSIAD